MSKWLNFNPQKMQDGGNAQQVLQLIILGLLSQPELTLAQLQLLGKEQQQLILAAISLMAQLGDSSAQQAIEVIQSITQSAKMGAKLEYLRSLKTGKNFSETTNKKEDKKSKYIIPEKREKGGKTSKCGCATLKRVGGKIVEVDCDGMPIKYSKNGGMITHNTKLQN